MVEHFLDRASEGHVSGYRIQQTNSLIVILIDNYCMQGSGSGR